MEYITIAEFAERAGVTPQAIYKRLKTDLEQFLKVEDGVKLLNVEALTLFEVKQQSKQATYVKELEELVTQLNKEKMELLSQLAANNQKLLEILEKQTQQQENYQVLLAQNQQLQATLMQLPKPVEKVENQDIQVEKTSLKHSWRNIFAKKNKVN